MQYASSHRSTSKKVELTKGLWNCSSRYVKFHYGGTFFELQSPSSVFSCLLCFQNSKGDEPRSTMLLVVLADMVAKSERCKGD
jgi:hypothetical protein